MVMIYGADGGLMASNEGTVNAGMIPAGKSVNFRAAFPGIREFAAAKFDVQGRGFRAPEAEGDAGTEPESQQEQEEAPPEQ